MAASTFTARVRTVRTPLDECFDVLGETHNRDVYSAIERLAAAGEQAGFSVPELIVMLRAGMSLETLLDVIEVKMTGTCIPDELRAA
jgi:hypothetical protein